MEFFLRWFRPRTALQVLALALLCAGAAQAQFSMLPTPAEAGPQRESAAEIEKEYRIDAARHIYTAYPGRIFRGKLPPLMYSVMVVETEIDSEGKVRGVNVVRKPAADEVAPWVVSMIRGAGPFPLPAKLPGKSVRYTDVWLVDKSGRFQVDTLTEGQR
jgi:periplasmic protein TonB